MIILNFIAHNYIRDATQESLDSFFDSISTPSLSDEARCELDSPLSMRKLSNAIDK